MSSDTERVALPEFKTILYCTTLGPHAPYVFSYACALAERLGAGIVALHVVESLTSKQRTLVDRYAGEGSLSALLEKAHERAARQLPDELKKVLSKVTGPEHWNRIVKEVVVAEGRTAKEILAHVESHKADLVVIGVHTESSVIDRVLGSTARSLVKGSPVPVLTVQVPSDL